MSTKIIVEPRRSGKTTKAILDALNGIVFKDDNQIVKLTVSKIYSPDPKAVVHIKEV